MTVLHIDHYNLRAPRELMETLREFYCSAIGLTLGPRPAFRSFGYWLYAGEKAILHLSEAPAEEAASLAGRSTFDHVAFKCVDRPAVEERLRGLDLEFKFVRVPLTGNVQLFLNDPAGNGVELNFTES